MVKCIFENLTLKQALMLARWYGDEGQDAAKAWFDTQKVVVPVVDRQIEGGHLHIVGQDVVVTLR